MLSPERKGRLTGSAVGAALGLCPWRTPEQLIRSMVREYHGAESEFQGNVATDYGTLREPLAMMDYMARTGEYPLDTQFYIHPEYDWIGATPDAPISDTKGLEVKCPYGLRNDPDPKFKTAAEQPHYYAQMQVEMACAGWDEIDFFQWSKHGSALETVKFDQEWWDDHLPAMRSFYNWYLSELDNPAHLEHLTKEINTDETANLLKQYEHACKSLDGAAARKKELLELIVKAAGESNAIIHGRKLTKVERAGSVSYAKAIKENLPDLDLTPYTGKPSEYWRLS